MTIRKSGEQVGFIHISVSLKPRDGSERSYEAEFLADTGATDTMAPASELTRAGIKPVGRLPYQLADGRVVEYDFGLAQIEFMGEITAGRVIFGPDETTPLLGVTALESTGTVIDPRTGQLKRLPAIPLKHFVAIASSRLELSPHRVEGRQRDDAHRIGAERPATDGDEATDRRAALDLAGRPSAFGPDQHGRTALRREIELGRGGRLDSGAGFDQHESR